MGETMCIRRNVSKMRVHDYLYDSSFIVSGARDYARSAFKAAMASAQVGIQPNFKTMFSDLKNRQRVNFVLHPNCRLPPHMDCSYRGYSRRARQAAAAPAPDPAGPLRYQFVHTPKQLLPLKVTSPDLHPASPRAPPEPSGPRHKITQTMYRESSAQTHPWQPDVSAAHCREVPEVLLLDNLKWGPGDPYRKGDLPADFHTTEIINKMRHARVWLELVEHGDLPCGFKKRNDIIKDIETKDWIFREAEIDELQQIRLELLQKMQHERREQQMEDSKDFLSLMKPERMDEESPSDEESVPSDASFYDEMPSSDSEDVEDWFALDVRAERAGDYIPLLGHRAFELLGEEKKRVVKKLTDLRESITSLNERSRDQMKEIENARKALAELDALLIHT